MTYEKFEEFVMQVKMMRYAQKEYFRTRDKGWLADAQQRERLVDAAIRQMESKKNNPELF